jgi:stage IV sporulation protein FB
MLIWIGVVFVSILVHELGHALAARSYGWQPWITLHGFGGLASYRPTYRSPVAQILISFAGPFAGFFFAGLILLVLRATGHALYAGWPHSILPVEFDRFESPGLNRLVFYLLYVNVFWGLVNLLPIWPLDGGRISQEVLSLVNPREGLQMALWLSIFVAAGAGLLAWTRLEDVYLTLFCGYLAYNSYVALQAYGGGGYR